MYSTPSGPEKPLMVMLMTLITTANLCSGLAIAGSWTAKEAGQLMKASTSNHSTNLLHFYSCEPAVISQAVVDIISCVGVSLRYKENFQCVQSL
ncbi:hypothetical protein V8F33_004754 [Rhypophila sp. PSN 637]